LASGVIATFNSSWTVRVRRDDLLTLQVDGTKGSAVAGLRDCVIQPYSETPRPIWNPDIDSPINFFDNWTTIPANQMLDNAFKAQWELFLKHVVDAGRFPFPYDLREGAKGVQLAELGLASWRKRAWVDVPALPE
jgi:predicted dehydrogenase